MSDSNSRPSKRVKKADPKLPRVVLPKRTPTELIDAIPPPPDYEPLPYRQIHRAPAVQLPLHANRDAYSLFTLFLTEAHFETIAANTNQYAEVKEAGTKGKRTWWPTCAAEIKVFIGTFVYMGVVRLPAYEDYWSSKYGEFICARHITLNHFEDLKRYMHISDPTPKTSSNDTQNDDSENETLEKSIK